MVSMTTNNIQIEDKKTRMSVDNLKRVFLDYLFDIWTKLPKIFTKNHHAITLNNYLSSEHHQKLS